MRALWPFGCVAVLLMLVVAGALTSRPASAAPTVQPCGMPDETAIVVLNVDHPLKEYFLGIGQSWWRKKLIPFPAGSLCMRSDKQAAVRLKRFYVLFQAFPGKPTRAQWNARFKPLVDAAISFDQWIVMTGGPRADGDYPGQDLAWLRSIRNSPYGTNLV